jgi:hypothetical protein
VRLSNQQAYNMAMSETDESPLKLSPVATEAVPAIRHWQFGIRHLLGLMTYVAVMLGIATWQGPQTLMATCGLGLALVSHLGALERLHSGRTQFVLFGLAWATFLVSLCAPCTTGPFQIYGWQAAWIYLAAPVQVIFATDSSVEPFGWPWLISIDLANILQALLPLLIWRLGRGRGQVLATISCLAMVGPWTTVVMATDLYVAYYLWCASFMLVVIAVPVNRATLIGMTCLAVLLVVIFRVFGLAP